MLPSPAIEGYVFWIKCINFKLRQKIEWNIKKVVKWLNEIMRKISTLCIRDSDKLNFIRPFHFTLKPILATPPAASKLIFEKWSKLTQIYLIFPMLSLQISDIRSVKRIRLYVSMELCKDLLKFIWPRNQFVIIWNQPRESIRGRRKWRRTWRPTCNRRQRASTA